MVKDFLKQFFLETFKRREKEEYQDLIAMNRKTNYPWFYLRIIVFIIIPISFLTILFHVFYLSTNIIILIYGAIFISFALFILLYELIKTREITFLQIMLIILFSGLIITPLVSFFYCYIPVKGDFLESVRAGTIEEIAKGIVACLLIYFINKYIYNYSFKEFYLNNKNNSKKICNKKEYNILLNQYIEQINKFECFVNWCKLWCWFCYW